MMTLTVRKIIVLGLVGIIFLPANILVVANWIAEKAGWIRGEFLTVTALAVIPAPRKPGSDPRRLLRQLPARPT
jgi:hypothetical protein